MCPSAPDFDLVASGSERAASEPWPLGILPRLFGPRSKHSVLLPGYRVIPSGTLGHSHVGSVEHMSEKSGSVLPSHSASWYKTA